MKKIVIGLVILVGVMVLWGVSKPSQRDSSVDETEVITRLQDAHGIAVDRENPNRVYIATHTGLLALVDDTEIVRVSDNRDDYMGFSAHPTDAKIFYTSGHPSRGGNIGFQKSVDGGKTWSKLSDGINGPVDFHAMTVSVANPDVIYGVYQGQLQRSNDGGMNWELAPETPTGIYTLATSPDDESVVYAGSSSGMLISRDKGNTWNDLNLEGVISALAVEANDGKKMIAYEVNTGLLMSNDSGKSWEALEDYSGDVIMHIAYDPQDGNVIYAINQSLEVYKTTDGAATWSKVR